MSQRTNRNALLSAFDADPGPWRPMQYPVTIPVPLEANQSEVGSVTIQNQPFIWMAIGHQIIGNTADPETSGLYQDAFVPYRKACLSIDEVDGKELIPPVYTGGDFLGKGQIYGHKNCNRT